MWGILELYRECFLYARMWHLDIHAACKDVSFTLKCNVDFSSALTISFASLICYWVQPLTLGTYLSMSGRRV